MEPHTKQLIFIIESTSWLMDVLRTVRSINLPDWYIGAGAIRNTIWNHLHGFDTNAHTTDVDVVYYDNQILDETPDIAYQTKLSTLAPAYDWEVVNQARAYEFKSAAGRNMPQATSACHGISTWTETATCIGVRLETNDTLTFCAPYGLDDLMNMIARPTPPPFRDMNIFHERMEKKEWDKIWPQLTIVHE